MELNGKCRNVNYDNEYAELIFNYENNLEQLEQLLGTDCIQILDNIYAIGHPLLSSFTENTLKYSGYSAFPRCYGLLDTTALEEAGILRVQNIPNMDLKGSGILIGMLDTGINYTNSLFKNADGSTKVLSIWDQNIISTNYPEFAEYGTVYNEAQINQALESADPISIVPSIDENGHGTYLASIIAGNRDEKNNFQGVVPEANLVIVKLKPAKQNIRDFYLIPQDAICYQDNDIMFGLKYLVDIANRLKRPMAICFALGTNQGSHSGNDNLSRYMEYIGRKIGICIITAAGNEGNSNHHYYGVINNNYSAKYNSVEISVDPDVHGFSMEIWGKVPGKYSIAITSPSGEYIPRIPAGLGQRRVVQFTFETTVILVNYEISEIETGDSLILLRFQGPSPGIWKIHVFGTENVTLDFHTWLPMDAFTKNKVVFVNANPDTTITTPGNAFYYLTISAYNHKDQSIFVDSSRGFTRNNLQKPDIVAPGVNVYGAVSENSFGIYSGTSIAAAIATGAAAMLLEWGILRGQDTLMNSIEIKNLLIRGAKRIPSQTYPNNIWGYGILDIFNTFINLTEL